MILKQPLLGIAVACLLVAGCSTLTRLEAVPLAAEDRITALGLPDARFWGDGDPEPFRLAMAAAVEREQRWLLSNGHTGPLPPANFLAVSGGGENGAFGAGLLVGWTAKGTRPEFKGVTGISTGALTAPFAFLGPAYDQQLREVYTTLSAKDILERRGYLFGLLQDAFADNAPLRRTVARYVDQAMLDAIAAEYAKGRVLLIGTTNLDARRPVIWNIGAIAASRHPNALQLVHDILVASSAIPGAFPAVMIDVQADGGNYQEMHVDGGASAQVFVYPPRLHVAEVTRGRFVRDRNLYVIRNARLDPDWTEVRRSTFNILGRAVTSLIQTQGIGDLYRIYLLARRDGIAFNLAYIPSSFHTQLKEPFDTDYMRELFEIGYKAAVTGNPWVSAPPDLAVTGSAGVPAKEPVKKSAKEPSPAGGRG